MKKLVSFINEKNSVQDIGFTHYSLSLSLSLFTKYEKKFWRQSVRLNCQSWTLDSFNCLLHIASTYLYSCLADFNARFELIFLQISTAFNPQMDFIRFQSCGFEQNILNFESNVSAYIVFHIFITWCRVIIFSFGIS